MSAESDPVTRMLAQLRAQLEAADSEATRAAIETLDRLEPVVALLRRSALHGFSEFEQHVGELSLLRKAGSLFGVIFDSGELCDGLLELVEESTRVSHAAIHLEPVEGSMGRVVRRGEVLSSESAAGIAQAIDAVREGGEGRALDLSGAQQAQLHPLVTQHQMLGVLVVAHEARDEDANRELALRLGALADFAALALRHSHLMEEHARHQRNLEAIVEERTREVTEARSALSRQQRIAAMGKLAASIAHEVNNPMSFLVSNLSRADEYAQEIAREIPALASALDSARHLPSLDDERVTHTRGLASKATSGTRLMLIAEEFGSVIAEAREGVDRIQRVGEDLRRFAQGVAGVAEPVDLNRLIETALHIARAEKKQDVTFECRFGAIPDVPCQRYQITQVLLNLLQNAVEAVNAGGAVRVASRVVDAFVEVEVADDGPGLDADQLDRIFEPFFTTKVDGSGLGLSISREIAAAHQGSLEATAGPEGASFRLRLPIRAGQAPSGGS